MGTDVAVAVRDVTRVFQAGTESVHALRGISLDIFQGEYLSIMGPSGSGKSTLFNMIGGLDHPTSGRVEVLGVALTDLSHLLQARMRSLCIGYIFQSYNLIPTLNALGNVALPGLFAGKDKASAERRAAELLEKVGLGHRMDHRPSELSGGQQQRVAIARSFANNPRIILADEPTGNLDTRTGEAIIADLSRLSREEGVTVISATHDHKMLQVSDRIVTIQDGRMHRIQTRDEIDIHVGSIEEATA